MCIRDRKKEARYTAKRSVELVKPTPYNSHQRQALNLVIMSTGEKGVYNIRWEKGQLNPETKPERQWKVPCLEEFKPLPVISKIVPMDEARTEMPPVVITPKNCSLKTTIINHVGPCPIKNCAKQLVQSYSADIKASAGFAKKSQDRYPNGFRENLREREPKLGRAYLYKNKDGGTDKCLITKEVSHAATSAIKDVEEAITDLSRKCRKTVHMPRIETGCNKHT